MGARIPNIWKAKGPGKDSYKFRSTAYISAALLITVHHLENGYPIGALETISVLGFIVLPNVFLYRYVKSGERLARVLHDNTYDIFFVGWFIGMVNLSVIPSFVYALGVATNYLAFRGFYKLYRFLLLPIGALIVFSLEGFHLHFESTTLMLTLALTYCVIHFVLNSYILYKTAYTVKLQNMEIQKQRMDIMEKSEELRTLNDSLQNLNIDLEIKVQNRTRELEIKNKKLEEYTFINAHQLRAPVASILGLIQLFDYKDAIETQQIIDALRKTAVELDVAIKSIRAKLEAEENLPKG